MSYDLVIKNGTVVDGTGAPRFRADVGVRHGRIAEVGRITGGGSRTIDAGGMVVSPGFFDVHTHYDCQILWDPLATSSCWHGVTSILMGNCGFGIAPAHQKDGEYLMRLMARVEGINLDVLHAALDFRWETFGDFLHRVGSNLGVNVAAQVPHCALRYYVMGKESYERTARVEEINTMKGLLRDALNAGAMGFSTAKTAHHTGGYGEPIPSRLAEPQELIDLCSVLSEFDRGIIGVNPYPGGGVIAPEFEATLVSMVKAGKRPVLWNQQMHRWDKPNLWKQNLDLMDRNAAKGAPLYAVARCQRMDMEFNLRATYLLDAFPTWKATIARPHEEKKKALRDPDLRAKLRAEWETMGAQQAGRRADLLEVGRAKLPKNQKLQGRPLVQIARETGKDLVDYLLDLSLEEDLDTQFVFIGSMNGDMNAVGQMIKHPYCVPGLSDAGAHLDMDCGVDFSGLLLGHWVREKGVMTLEEGVRRLTSMSAKVLGLADRGLLREGMAADVVVFDPASIAALPREILHDVPGGNPRIVQRAVGVKAVIVNGQPLFEDGRHTGALPGKVLGAMAARS